MIRHALTALLALGASGCLTPLDPIMPDLARAQVASDLDTYRLERIGLLPFSGEVLPARRRAELQQALHTELSGAGPYELVLLTEKDLAEIETSEPYKRGWYRPRTIIDLSQRYQLDGLLVGTVTQLRFYPPQILGLQVDLVASETGLVVWSAQVHLDAEDRMVRQGLDIFYSGDRDRQAGKLALLSPERFARFAVFQVGRAFAR